MSLIFPLIIAVLYLLCVSLISQFSIVSGYKLIYPYLLLIFEIPICVIYLSSYYVKREYDIYDILNVLIIVGVMQAIIAIICFFVPSIKDVVVNNFLAKQFSDYFTQDIIFYLSQLRLNGLSSGMTFTMPVVQALIGMISLYLAINRNLKYLIPVPLLVFSAIINARNAIVVLTYGIILIIIMLTKKKKTQIRLLITAALTVILVLFMMHIMNNQSNLVSQWILDGLNETFSFFQGEKVQVGYYDTLMSNFIIFPEGLSLFFGTGKSIFGLDIGLGSDIGYINDIWLGGLLFISIAYFAFLSYFIKAYNKGDKLIKFIVLLFISTFLIMNIKGTIVSNNGFINISVFLSMVFILNNSSNLSKAYVEKI